MSRIAAFFLAVAACLLSHDPASAAQTQVTFGPDLEAAGWKDLTFRRLKPNTFSAPDARSLNVSSESAVSVIWRFLPRGSADTATASWQWRVDTSVPPTDLSKRNRDDRNLALYFIFADNPKTLDNPPKSLKGAMLKGRALIYTWGGKHEQGTIIASPGLLGRAQMVIQRPGDQPLGQWVSETVDLSRDFERAFGRKAGPLMGVGVSSDSDSTETAARAALRNLVLD